VKTNGRVLDVVSFYDASRCHFGDCSCNRFLFLWVVFVGRGPSQIEDPHVESAPGH